MTALLLLTYCIALGIYMRVTARQSYSRITLDVDWYFAQKARHAAVYGTIADWREVMDACDLFWSARK